MTIGGSVDDQATISGGFNPGGSITWRIYASTDTNCTGTILFTSTAQSVSGNNTYTSSSFTTSTVGSFKWGFSYTGDGSNNEVSECGGSGESLTVDQATPTLGTSTTVSVNAGGLVTDAVTLADSHLPSGTITYTLFGPSPTMSCTAQVGQVTSNVASGNGDYTSPTISTPSAGTYWWIANYGGDADNLATTNGCGASGASSPTKVTPTVTTSTGLTPVTVGGSLADRSTLSGGSSPTGTITWSLYDNNSCGGSALFMTSSGGSVSANSTYTSNSFTTTSAGTFTWKFSYGGDTNNEAVSACGGAGQSVTVKPALNLSTLPAATVGVIYSQTLTASGGASPYSYSIGSGSLPPGLSINTATGAITGTPTAGGSFSFTVSAADSSTPTPSTASQAYTLSVNQATITLYPITLPNGSEGTTYDKTIIAAGGTGPYSYRVSSGSLPTNLNLNPSTGAIVGTPTVPGSFTFSVTAADSSTGNGPYIGSQTYIVTIDPS